MAKPVEVSKALEKKIRKALIKSLETACLLVENSAIDKCPVNNSQLINSIKHYVDEKKLLGTVYTNVSYAPHVEYGTRPHIIKPKNKKALTIPKAGGRLVWRGEQRKTEFKFGGKTAIADVHFAKKVRHPGTREQPFLRPALWTNESKIKEIFAKNLNAIR